MTTHRCPVHDTPVKGATLCGDCVTALERDLGDLPALWDDLEVTVTRQSVMGGSQVGGHSDERPVPFNVAAARVARKVWQELAGWVSELLPTRMLAGPMHDRCGHVSCERMRRDRTVPRDVPSMARWLHRRADRLAHHPAAFELAGDVDRLVRLLRHTIDRQPDLLYAGPCRPTSTPNECMTQVPGDDGPRMVESSLYVTPGASVVTCRTCDARYDVAERRAWLLAMAEDQLAHAELIGRAAPALGVDITPAAVRGYKARGRIVPHGVDAQGRELFRVGDVIEVAMQVTAERERRAEKAAAKAERRSA